MKKRITDRCACGSSDIPPRHLKVNHFVCYACQRAKDAAYRARRRAEGRPIKTEPYRDKEARAGAMSEYRKRPDVLAREAERMRARTKDPSEALKCAARRAVRHALETGRMVRGVCHCGNTKAQAHHDDYSKPLDVRWLCRPHHNEVHRASRKGAR